MDKNYETRIDWNVPNAEVINNLNEQIENKIIIAKELKDCRDYLKACKEIKDTYESILFIDEKNHSALMDLAQIECVLGNTENAVKLWERAADAASTVEDKIKALSLICAGCREEGDYKKSIEACNKMISADGHCVEAVITLAEIYYQDLKDVKSAVSLLEKRYNATVRESEKTAYMCECLMAVRFLPEIRNPQIEKSICRRLRKLWTDDEQENKAGMFYIMSALEKALKRQDYKCFEYLYRTGVFHGSEKSFLNTRFKAIFQYEQLLKDGSVCSSLNQYLTDESHGRTHYKIMHDMVLDAIKVQKSLYEIRYNAPLFWKAMGSRFHELEQEMQTLCPLIGEYEHFINDESYDAKLKYILKILIVAPYGELTPEDKKEFYECCQDFFNKERRHEGRKVLGLLKSTYPLCYDILINRLLSQKTCSGKNQPVTVLINADGWEKETDTAGIQGFFELWGNQIDLPDCLRKRHGFSSKHKPVNGSGIEKKYEEQIMFQQLEFDKLINPSPLYMEQQRMEREAVDMEVRRNKKRKLRKRILIAVAIVLVLVFCVLIGIGIYNA